MSKVLFVNVGLSGHINPTLPLVEELVKRGDEVTYFATEEFKDKIEQTGATFKSYEGILHIENNNKLHIIALIETILIITQKAIPFILDEIKNDKFDYVLYDAMYNTGKLIGEILNIPTIAVYTTFAFAQMPKKLQDVDINFIVNSGTHELDDYYRIANEIKEKFAVNPPKPFEVFCGHDKLSVVFTSKYFQIDSQEFDNTYKFVGPSIADRKEESNIPYDELKDNKIIYISLGTLRNNNTEFYQKCFEAFKDSHLKVILSVGNKIDINTFENIPNNFIVRNYVSQLEVLKLADVFITHGGMNSANEGLYYNVPLIVIPMGGLDQPLVAKRVSDLGAGIYLQKENITSDLLRESALKIFSDDNYSKNAKLIGDSFKSAGGFKQAADEIFLFKNETLK